jgi:hypothetical protein
VHKLVASSDLLFFSLIMSRFSWKNVFFASAMACTIHVAIAAGVGNVGDLEASIQRGHIIALVSAIEREHKKGYRCFEDTVHGFEAPLFAALLGGHR